MKYVLLSIIALGFNQHALGRSVSCSLTDLTSGEHVVVAQASHPSSSISLYAKFEEVVGKFKVIGDISFYADYDESNGKVKATIHYLNSSAKIGELTGGIGLNKNPSITIYDTSESGSGNPLVNFDCYYNNY